MINLVRQKMKGPVRPSRAWIVGVVSLFLSACAALNPIHLEDVMRTLESAKSCCASVTDFDYEPLLPLDSRTFDITSEFATFEFPTGKS